MRLNLLAHEYTAVCSRVNVDLVVLVTTGEHLCND